MTSKVITKLSVPHRAVDLRDFLDEIDRQTHPDLAVHVIFDSLSVHKAPVVHKRLLAHPRFQLHFTPAYSSWINRDERWFARLERRRLERGAFCFLDGLRTTLDSWIKVANAQAEDLAHTADNRGDDRGRGGRSSVGRTGRARRTTAPQVSDGGLSPLPHGRTGTDSRVAPGGACTTPWPLGTSSRAAMCSVCGNESFGPAYGDSRGMGIGTGLPLPRRAVIRLTRFGGRRRRHGS
ncbi:transposase [Streptomyces sp. NPDC058623]|uniref:transposase n=1 Tax=Streptomyces sp. NPDC058623 TaxID=3346563 RepID=UPI00366540C5